MSSHMRIIFILPILVLHANSEEAGELKKDCVVPDNTPHSKWFINDGTDKEILPGTYVKDKSKIQAVCDQNYTRLTLPNVGECKNVTWDFGYTKKCEDIYVNVSDPKRDCEIPAHPENGKWVTHDSKTVLEPGKFMKISSSISVICNKHYKSFSTVTHVICDDTFWDNNVDKLGDCQAFCPPLLSTEKFKVTCIVKGRRFENCTESLEATIAEITCRPIYQNQHIYESRSKFRVCLRGRWDNNILPNCIPKMECGLKPSNLKPLIVNGKEVSKGGYPWHVALFEEKIGGMTVICGGSLISNRVVITAAHCVTSVNGNLKDIDRYVAAVGKQYSNFQDSRESSAQFSKLNRIFVPDEYKGSTRNFAGDIAILVTTKNFKLEDGVLPICVNFGTEKLEEKLLANEKNIGYVPGFGLTETGNVSEVLKELSVPVIKQDKCSKHLPEDFIEYYSYDKFCAGFLNESTSVCSGDSGGGLVIQNPEDNRFYLTGIVSVSPVDVSGSLICDIQQYALYTKVWDYIDFIAKESGEYLQINSNENSSSLVGTSVKECQKYIKSMNTLPVDIIEEEFFKNVVVEGKFQFFGLIKIDNLDGTRQFCVGSLISDQFLLTAAHCVFNREQISSVTVRLGVYNYEEPLNATNSKVKEFTASQNFYIHPNFQPSPLYNDIALLKFTKKVQFTDYIRPACLYQETVLPASATRSATWANKRRVLKTSVLQVQKPENCELFSRLSSEILPDGFVNGIQICASPSVYAVRTVQHNFCELLGGEPLPIRETDPDLKKDYYRVAGVSSYSKECKNVNNLVLFTKVAPYIPWIENIVWPVSKE